MVSDVIKIHSFKCNEFNGLDSPCFFLFIHALKMKRFLFLFLFLFGSNIEIAHLTLHLTLPALNTSHGDKKRIWEPFEHSKSQIVIILLRICLSFVRAIKSHNPQPFHNWHIEPLFNMFYSRWNLDNIKNNFFCMQLIPNSFYFYSYVPKICSYQSLDILLIIAFYFYESCKIQFFSLFQTKSWKQCFLPQCLFLL